MKLRIATRKSPLALAQTRWVAERIRAHAPHVEVEELQLVTEGDRVLDVPLAKVGGKGLFVTEVERALVEGQADIAVHSLKDVPEQLAAGMIIACIPEREDPRDVLVSAEGTELMSLEAGVRVGTSSLRRAIQLRAQRSDVEIAVLRGNVGTRLRKLDEGHYGAILLAYAGLKRLELDRDRKLWPVPIDVSIPAVGQGALAIEARVGDAATLALLAPLEHSETRIAVEAERAYLETLHGSCTTPLACHARFEAGRFRVDAMVGSLDGGTILLAGTDEQLRGDVAAQRAAARRIGIEIAERQLASGAKKIVENARSGGDPYAHGLYSGYGRGS